MVVSIIFRSEDGQEDSLSGQDEPTDSYCCERMLGSPYALEIIKD